MKTWISALDRLLRGDATRISALRYGSFEIPVGGLSMMIVLLGLFYGLCMSCYAIFSGADSIGLRVTATMMKVPLLFLLTLGITYPSLYIFNALVGSRLAMGSVLQLLVGSLAVMLSVLASLGPIVAFFSVSTTSYSFMLLLNVAVFAIAGILGLRFLLRTLHRLSDVHREAEQEAANDATRLEAAFDGIAAGPAPAAFATMAGEVGPMGPAVVAEPSRIRRIRAEMRNGALDKGAHEQKNPAVNRIFRVWVVVFGLVGAQLSWVMRPFIGGATGSFEWFGSRESSFFEAVLKELINFLL